MENNRVTASISFDINVSCPHCDKYLSLGSQEEFPDLNEYDDEPAAFIQMMKDWFNNEKGADEPNLFLDCPKCKKAFVIEKMEY